MIPSNSILSNKAQTTRLVSQRVSLRANSKQAIYLTSIMMSVLLLYVSAFDVVYAGSSGSAESELLLINDAYHMIQIKTSPAILSEKNEHVLFVLSLENVDDADSEPLSDVMYNLRFTDGPNSATILADFDVYSPDAELPVMIIPTDDDFVVSGDIFKDESWMSTDTSPVTLEAPIFLSGGIVYIHVSILSIDSNPVSTVDNTFEIMFSMGEYVPFSFDIDGTAHDVVFATYFDEISEFEYDEHTRSLSAEMPFTWTSEYIEAASFIHAEYFIPKTIGLFEDHEILLAVNGMDYFGTVDRSGQDEIVIHYLLSAVKLHEMLETLDPNYADRIVFEIRAGDMRQHQVDGNASLESGDTIVITSTGSHQNSYTLYLDAEPAGMIHPENEIVLLLEIRDVYSDELVLDATYDLELLFGDEVVISEIGRVASQGNDVITTIFEKPGIVTLKISNIEDSGAGGKFTFVVSEPHDMSAMDDHGHHGGGSGGDNDHGHDMDHDSSKMNMDEEMSAMKKEMDSLQQERDDIEEEFGTILYEHPNTFREYTATMQKFDAFVDTQNFTMQEFDTFVDGIVMDLQQYMITIKKHEQIIDKHNETMARHNMIMSEHVQTMSDHTAGMKKGTHHYDTMAAMHEKMQSQHQLMANMEQALFELYTAILEDHDTVYEQYEYITSIEYSDVIISASDDKVEEEGGGGCLIATAAFGSELAPQVQQLRDLRDNTILATASGTVFMSGFNQAYYTFSPTIADLERENPVFKYVVRIALTPMLSSLLLLDHVNIDTESEMLGYGISVILLNIVMYIGAPLLVIMWCVRMIRAQRLQRQRQQQQLGYIQQ